MTLTGLLEKWKSEESQQINQTEYAMGANLGREVQRRMCADELASTLKGMTCGTCKHGRGMSEPEAMNDEPRCCHPSEAHPLHWQETSPSFGCLDWAASPPLEGK